MEHLVCHVHTISLSDLSGFDQSMLDRMVIRDIDEISLTITIDYYPEE